LEVLTGFGPLPVTAAASKVYQWSLVMILGSTNSPALASRGCNRRHTVDAVSWRRYLGGVESLAREAKLSDDPRVMLDALHVLERQGAEVRRLLGSAFPDCGREPFNLTDAELQSEWGQR
jgi:hypothetical protein